MVQSDAVLRAKILIVEDDRMSLRLIRSILEEAGFFNLRFSASASKLTETYMQYRPDLLILDLNLPDVDGFEAMRRLRVADPDDYLPILVISSETEDHVHLRALSAGAKDFLSKPYDRSKVLLRSRNLIEVRLLHEEVKNKNRDLESMVAARTKELRDSRIDVIRRLGSAAEYRDKETGQHILRMSRYAAALAKAMGMSEDETDLVLTTSPLHDIGKIAIPDRILLKPGPLSTEEWEVMKTHADIGGRLLSGGDSAFLLMAEAIARSHHERWDGQGYPDKLRQEEIPLVGRICSVCDVFDALTSERPYKDPWTFEDAVKEIKRLRGSSFDPAVVDAFVEILPEIGLIFGDVEKMTQETARSILRGNSSSLSS